jgi:hypothetical protein
VSALCASCGSRQPVGGLLVCAGCERAVREGLRELPGLYEDLLQPTRPGRGGKVRLAGHEPPLVRADEPRRAREAIRNCLVTWCLVLAEDFGVGYPADTVEAMCHTVGVQAGRLLATEHADQLHHDVTGAVREARRRAYLSRPERIPIGHCPACRTMVRAKPEEETITCPGCGDAGVLSWWVGRLVLGPDAGQHASARDLAPWLSVRTGTVVQQGTIRQWASRGLLIRQGRDGQGRTLYDIASALRIALGRQRSVRV